MMLQPAVYITQFVRSMQVTAAKRAKNSPSQKTRNRR